MRAGNATLNTIGGAVATLIAGTDSTLIAELYQENRVIVPLTRVPTHVAEAFIAVEDRRFYQHSGIDPRGILRALWDNVWAGGLRSGGSTIS